MPWHRTTLVACVALCLGWTIGAPAELNVVYPDIEERSADYYSYKVLRLALEKSGQPYRLSVSATKMNQARARKMLEGGNPMISVLDVGTSAEFEERMRAVYFPIDRGLSGYRLFIVNKGLAAEFAGIQNLHGLTRKVAGQGPGWSDIGILENAGIQVRVAEFENLFRMVDRRRFDFFPLGVEEIYGFFERYRLMAPNTMVETKLALHYPFARLFFVRKDDEALAEALTRGLERAFDDGSFQRLLDGDQAFQLALKRADLGARTIIEIDNPNLTPRFRAIPARYFFQP